MARPVARRHRHEYPEQDLLSLAASAVAHWLSDLSLDLQWRIAGQIESAA